MLPDGRRLGAHLPLGGGMVKAVERAHEIGATAMQIFSDNPTAWRRRTQPPKELAAFRRRLDAFDIGPLAIHASYLVNLAGPDEDFFAKSVVVLASELRVAPSFGARFVNVHIGSHRGTGPEAGIARVADGLALALAEVDPGPDAALLVLENSAGSGFGIGVSVDELAAIREAAAARGVDTARFGFCLDTAHAWGAGIPISDPAATDALLEAFERTIGLDRLVMVHLNDSKSALGSNTDRHAHIGAGEIGAPGLAHIITHPLLAAVTYYLETPGMDEGYDAINVARAYALAAGEPLPELPAGARHARGGHARTGPPPGGRGVRSRDAAAQS